MKYRCVDCGYITDKPDTYKEDYGEKFNICPYCKGEVEPVYLCSECEEYKVEDEWADLCDDCKTKTLKDFQLILRENFGEEQIKYLNEAYEGMQF